MKLILGLAVLSCAWAQNGFEAGVRAGYSGPAVLPDLSFLTGYYQSITHHPYIGLSLSVPLAERLGLRFDPVYQRIGFDTSTYGGIFSPSGQFGAISSKTATTANRLLFPVLVEWRVVRHLRAGIGPSISAFAGDRTLAVVRNPFTGTQTFTVNYLPPLDRQVTVGGAAAVEFPVRFGPVVVAPEFRYTRWFSRHYGGYWRMNEVSSGVAIRFGR